MDSLIKSNIGDASAMLSRDANEIKAEVLALAANIKQVTTPAELEAATARHRDIKRLLSQVEADRKAIKEPVIQLGRKIDQIAQEYCMALEAEAERIGGSPAKRIPGLIGHFVAAEAERVRKEQEQLETERREQEQRLADALRQQEIEANRKKPNAAKEIAAEVAVIEAQAGLQQVQTIAPPTMARAAGLVVKTKVDYEITDIGALYEQRPEWFELVPRKSVIAASITKNTKLPGLKVWETVVAGTRK